jgi:hypothetical protein
VTISIETAKLKRLRCSIRMQKKMVLIVSSNNMPVIKDLICEAIKTKQRLSFVYNDKLRVAEPQCCGQTTAGKDAIRATLISGGSRPEQLFEPDKIKSFQLLDEYFTEAGPNYKRNDSAMRVIYCQL